MKKIFIFILLVISTVNAFADCDWSTGITSGPNHTFIYSDACHLEVGRLVQNNKTQAAQIQDLTKAIELKDLAIVNADARTQIWMTAAQNEQDRMAKLQAEQKHDNWIMFGLGVATVIGSGFMTARLIGH